MSEEREFTIQAPLSGATMSLRVNDKGVVSIPGATTIGEVDGVSRVYPATEIVNLETGEVYNSNLLGGPLLTLTKEALTLIKAQL